MKVLVVAGARPNFMKIAPVLRELRARGHDAVLVHTGQHYDAQMSDNFFTDLRIPRPDHHLGVGSGSHAAQTARIMESFEPVLLDVAPDWMVVVGDVNSTLACALVASKLGPDRAGRIAHVEAGLRSGDWRMPEEINRVLTDSLSDLLLTTSEDAAENLEAEGIPLERVVFAGNVMIDTLLAELPAARAVNMFEQMGLTRAGYAVATVHRPSNVDDSRALEAIVDALRRVRATMPVVLSLHPRTQKNIADFGFSDLLADLTVVGPLGYLELLSLTDAAAVVLTDSGGLQEETTVLGVPCVTLREQTERPITITHGTNRLAPWPLSADGVLASMTAAIAEGRRGVGEKAPRGWDGLASSRVVDALETSQTSRIASTVAR